VSSIPKHILVLNYRHVGDVLFTTPALRALRRRFPESYIAVVVGSQAEAILENNPHLNELIVLPRASFREKWSIRHSLMARRFDTGILFQHTFLNTLFLLGIGCRLRAGLAWKGCGPLLTHRTPYLPDRHEVDRYLAIVQTLGARADGAGLEMPLQEPERAWGKAFLEQNGVVPGDLLIGIFPGSSAEWTIKRWPPIRFAAVADTLTRRHGAKILLLGGPSDREAAEEVAEAMATRPINAVSRTDLKQLAALLEQCAMLITNDTGPMHLATAVGTTVVDLVGPGDPRKTGPYGSGHVALQKVPPGSTKSWKKRKGNPMELITVEEVVQIVSERLLSAAQKKTASLPPSQMPLPDMETP